jgi:hypothetical protein
MPTLDRVEINPKVMLGKPIIRGTRITWNSFCVSWAKAHPIRNCWKPTRISRKATFRPRSFSESRRVSSPEIAGDRRGQQSIRINEQWRICFEWREGAAGNVAIVDCHKG